MRIRNIVATQDKLNDSDLGTDIEVKTRSGKDERFWDMAVNCEGIKPERIYVLCLAHLFPQYVIVAGWTYGRNIIQLNQKENNSFKGQPFYVYPRKELYKVNQLFDVLRKRTYAKV